MLDHCQTDGFIRSKTFSVSAGVRKNYFIYHAIFHCIMKNCGKLSVTGADLGGGGGGDVPFSQGFDPLPTQRVPPLILFRNPFLADRP